MVTRHGSVGTAFGVGLRRAFRECSLPHCAARAQRKPASALRMSAVEVDVEGFASVVSLNEPPLSARRSKSELLGSVSMETQSTHGPRGFDHKK